MNNLKNDDFVSDQEKLLLDNLIREAMSDDFSVDIPSNFADKMERKAMQINKQRFWREEISKQLVFFFGGLLLFAVALGIFFYYQPKQIVPLGEFILQYKWIFIAGLAGVFFFQLIDGWIHKRLNIR